MRALKILAAVSTAAFVCGGPALAQDFAVLHNFGSTGPVTFPETTLIEVSPGVFVGSYTGGLFQVSSAGEFALFSSFADSPYNAAEEGALSPATNGFLYGVRSTGGGPSAVYRITPSGAEHAIVNTGLSNASPLMEASDGVLWGTQGPEDGPFSVFRVSLNGGTLTTVANGLAGPTYGPLLQASDGRFYGSTGVYTPGGGQVYRVTPSGDVTVLHTFPDGEGAIGGLIEASNKSIYGTTLTADPACSVSGGRIFVISPAGSFKTLYEYPADCLGNAPAAGLLEASDGNLYGTTDLGGVLGDGTIFRIGLDGAGYSDLFTFAYSGGAAPITYGPALTQGSDGKLYGTASGGGSDGGGVVFEFDNFLPQPLPRVGLAQPQVAEPGATIRLSGNYLLGLSAVAFNGTPAAFTAVNVNYAYAVVPASATTGPITVTTPNGAYTSKFVFTVE